MGKRSGLGKRSGYMDADTRAEDRDILRFNRQWASDKRRERESERDRSALESMLNRINASGLKAEADDLVARLLGGEPFSEAADAAAPADADHEWARVRKGLASVWERRHPGTVASRELERKVQRQPDQVGDALTGAARSSPGFEDMKREAAWLIRNLREGSPIKVAAARAWAGAQKRRDDLDPDVRRDLGRRWSLLVRAVGDEWAKTHPNDKLEEVSDAERFERRRARVHAMMVAAGQAVPSWTVLEVEGMLLIDSLMAGARFPEAARAGAKELKGRTGSLSEEEEALVRREWSKILDALAAEWHRVRGVSVVGKRPAAKPSEPVVAPEPAIEPCGEESTEVEPGPAGSPGPSAR